MKFTIYFLLILSFFAVLPSVTEAQSSCSGGGSQVPVELAVPNLSDQVLSVYWIDFQCSEQFMQNVASGEIFYQSTYDGHEWVFRDPNGREVTQFTTSVNSPTVIIGAASFNPEPVTSQCSSAGTNTEIPLNVINNTDEPILLFWIGWDCVEWLYQVVPAVDRIVQNTFVGHDWIVRYSDGRTAEHITTGPNSDTVTVNPPPQPQTQTQAQATATVPPTAAPPATDDTTAAFPVTESGCEVASVPFSMGRDSFYTKYCEYEGLLILGSANADDVALEQAWLVAANMWFHRPDVVESLVEMGFFIAIMGDDQQLTNVPELRYLAEDPSANIDESRAYTKVLEEPRLAAVAEENLVCTANDVNSDENLLVGRLANITRFALVMDLDPSMNDKVGTARQTALDNGLWAAFAWMTENNGSYWDYGVQLYFNSAIDELLPGDPARTRIALVDYDPDLYDLIDSVFQTDDWTPSCSDETSTSGGSPATGNNEATTASSNTPTCQVQGSGANKRAEPSTQAASVGTLNGATTAVAQAQGADGLTWYRLADGGWVRSDVVTAEALCADLPVGE